MNDMAPHHRKIVASLRKLLPDEYATGCATLDRELYGKE